MSWIIIKRRCDQVKELLMEFVSFTSYSNVHVNGRDIHSLEKTSYTSEALISYILSKSEGNNLNFSDLIASTFY